MNRFALTSTLVGLSLSLALPMIDATLKGTLLLLAAGAVLVALRRQSAALRHFIGMIALGLLLLLPILAAVLPGWRVLPATLNLTIEDSTEATTDDSSSRPSPELATTSPAGIDTAHHSMTSTTQGTARPIETQPATDDSPRSAIDATPLTAFQPPSIGISEELPSGEAARPADSNSPAMHASTIAIIFGLWLVGSFMLLSRLVTDAWRLHRFGRRTQVLRAGAIFEEFQRCCAEMGVAMPVELLVGDDQTLPMTWGTLRPRVMIPSVANAWPASQRRSVLLHELGHVVRRDPLWQIISKVALACYWFHPLVWLTVWRIHVEREQACDDLVINRGVSAKDYARHLLDVVSGGRVRRIGPAVGVSMASNTNLEGRVRSILDRRRNRHPLSTALLFCGIVAAMIVGFPLAMIQAEAELTAGDAAPVDAAPGHGDESANDKRLLLGFDLTPHAFTGDWDALLESDGPLGDLPVTRGGCWRYTNPQRSWFLYYSPVRQTFYVRLREDDSDHHYGPINGNAIDLLHIEQYLPDEANADAEFDRRINSQAMSGIESLISSGEPSLIESGFRALLNVEALTILEDHAWREPILKAVADTRGLPEFEELNREVSAYMTAQHEHIEERKVLLDDNEYTPGREPTEAELAVAWGPEVEGLALAMYPWEGDEPRLQIGDRIEADMLIRNMGDAPRKMSTFDVLDGVGAVITDEQTGLSALLRFTLLSGEPMTERYLLEPGQLVRIKRPYFTLVQGDLYPPGRTFNPPNPDIMYDEVRVREGHTYQIEFHLNLPSGTSYGRDGTILLPARGDFHGALEAPPLQFAVGRPLAADDPSPPDYESITTADDDGNTRITPANVDPELIDQILSWGSNQSQGWRVGTLLVNDLVSDEPLTPGDTIAIQYFLQNVSDEPQTIRVHRNRGFHTHFLERGRITISISPGSEVLEITARPGEAVSPEDFTLLLESTGLPSGEYTVNSNGIFLIPDEDGNGGSSPWRVSNVTLTVGERGGGGARATTDNDAATDGGRESSEVEQPVTSPDYDSITTEDADGNTRMTPGNVDREIIDQVLVWGSNERMGWRVGALLVNDLVSDDPLTPGDTIAVQYFLQNVSDEPQTIRSWRVDRTYPILGEGGEIALNVMHGGGVVDITAQPGEAVSPESFAILLESTGLPDGEYLIDTTSAFSIPNENGNGGSSPWRVGSVTLTIGEGGEFDAGSTTDDEGVVWGGEVAGLRVGMRLPEGRKEWPVGSLLEGELFVRNTTDEAITFQWDKPASIDQNQVVYDANGEYVRLNRVFFSGARARNPQTFTVPPGEQIRLGDAQLKSQAEQSEIQFGEPAQLVAASGEFTWNVHVELPREDIPELSIIAGSGPVPFEIVAADDAEIEDAERETP